MPIGIIPDLPRRHCDNCGVLYRPKQRVKDGHRGFHHPNCRKEFHKHGGSFSKLKPVIETEVRRRIKALSPADHVRMEEIEKRLAELERIIEIARGALNRPDLYDVMLRASDPNYVVNR